MGLNIISQERLKTCHPDLQKLITEVAEHFDIIVVCGHRGEADQHKAFVEGKSKVDWPNGKHNALPSLAVDIAPLIGGVIEWENRQMFAYLGGFVMATAASLGIKCRWGNDWNMNHNITERVKGDSWDDSPHFELTT